MGLTQWAAAASEGLGALAPAVTATQVHGATFGGGAVGNNAPLERRAEVLTCINAPLDEPVEAIGPVRVCLRVRSSLECFRCIRTRS